MAALLYLNKLLEYYGIYLPIEEISRQNKLHEFCRLIPE